MNSLSWLLWLSDVTPKIGAITGTFAALGALAAIVLTALGLFLKADSNYTSNYEQRSASVEMARLSCVSAAKRVWPIAIVAMLISAIMPDKTTVLAIAASEVGQTTINTPEAVEIKNEALRTLRDWLKSHQAKETKK